MAEAPDFVCDKGQDFPVRFGLRQKSAQMMVDLTGATVVVQVRAVKEDELPLAGFDLRTSNATLTYDPVTGYVSGKVAKEATAALPKSLTRGHIAAFITWATGQQDRLFEATVRFNHKLVVS